MKNIIKKFPLLVVLALFSITLSSCKNTSNKINGEWNQVMNDPNIVMDSSIKYSFTPDNYFTQETYHAISNETYKNDGEYILNWIEQTIIFNPNGDKKEYKIVNITKDQLQLEKVCKKGNPQDIINLQRRI